MTLQRISELHGVVYNGRKDTLLTQQKILEDNSNTDRPDGEQPTIYHIPQTKVRRAERNVYCLRDEEGQMHTTPSGIAQTLTTFLRKIYEIIIVIFIAAIGLSPFGGCYFTRIQNVKLFTTKFKSVGLHEEHVVRTCNLGNHLSICFRHRETNTNLCRNSWSQDLPNTDL